MKSMMRTLKWALGVALFVAVSASLSNAQCMKFNVSKQGASLLKPQSLSRMTSPAAFAPVANASEHERGDTDDDPMLGFWYVTFTSDTPGVFFDWAFNQFHSDGTEMMNSGSLGPSAFCMGVWKRTGHRQYTVNHFPIPYDTTTDPKNPVLIGIIQIREKITLSGDHNSFTGTFSQGLYDKDGNLLEPPYGPGLFTGKLEGHRITVDTPVTDVLPASPPAP
jgi:hypothetical protein